MALEDGLGNEINRIATANRSDPSKLNKEVKISGSLIKAMAAQQISDDIKLVAQQQALQAGSTASSDTVLAQLEDELLTNNQKKKAEAVAGVMGQRQNKAVARQQPRGMPQGQPPPMPQGMPQSMPQGMPARMAARGGLMRVPRPNLQNMAQGGIIGFHKGGVPGHVNPHPANSTTATDSVESLKAGIVPKIKDFIAQRGGKLTPQEMSDIISASRNNPEVINFLEKDQGFDVAKLDLEQVLATTAGGANIESDIPVANVTGPVAAGVDGLSDDEMGLAGIPDTSEKAEVAEAEGTGRFADGSPENDERFRNVGIGETFDLMGQGVKDGLGALKNSILSDQAKKRIAGRSDAESSSRVGPDGSTSGASLNPPSTVFDDIDAVGSDAIESGPATGTGINATTGAANNATTGTGINATTGAANNATTSTDGLDAEKKPKEEEDPESGINSLLGKVGLDVNSLTAPKPTGMRTAALTDAVGVDRMQDIEDRSRQSPEVASEMSIADQKTLMDTDKINEEYAKLYQQQKEIDQKYDMDASGNEEAKKEGEYNAWISGVIQNGTIAGGRITMSKYHANIAKYATGAAQRQLAIFDAGAARKIDMANKISKEAGLVMGRVIKDRSEAAALLVTIDKGDLSQYNAEAKQELQRNTDGIGSKLNALATQVNAQLQQSIADNATQSENTTLLGKLVDIKKEALKDYMIQRSGALESLQSILDANDLGSAKYKAADAKMKEYNVKFQAMWEDVGLHDTITSLEQLILGDKVDDDIDVDPEVTALLKKYNVK